MNYKTNLTSLLIIITNFLFSLNPQIKEELPLSIYIDPDKYISIDVLLKFEDLGYDIEDPIEKSQYYFIVAYLLNERTIELNVKTDNMIEKISDLINSYEEKLYKNHYIVHYEMPVFDYQYEYIKFSDKAVINKVFYKQASALKKQYTQIHNAKMRKFELLSDYLLALREEYVIARTKLKNIKYEENLEDRFYFTLQDMLSDNLIEKSKLSFLSTVIDNNGNIMSVINIQDSNEGYIILSKDFEYFNDGLLAGIRERKNGILKKEILYGANKYSDKFYNFIFDSSFQPLNYDNFTEVYYELNNQISHIVFFTFNSIEIGSIEYEYDILDRLINEKWYKGERLLIREFNCFYTPGQGDYRVIEKNKYGEIVFQDIINSNNKHIRIEGE